MDENRADRNQRKFSLGYKIKCQKFKCLKIKCQKKTLNKKKFIILQYTASNNWWI